MGWSIETNHKDKWSIISSVTDNAIATFQTEKEMVNFLALSNVYEGKKKAVETLMTFPDNWFINDERVLANDRDNKFKLYFGWINSIAKVETDEKYYKLIDDKLEELLG